MESAKVKLALRSHLVNLNQEMWQKEAQLYICQYTIFSCTELEFIWRQFPQTMSNLLINKETSFL